MDKIGEFLSQKTPRSLLVSALLKAPFCNPFFDGEVLAEVGHIQNLASTSKVRWITGGVIRSFDRWGWGALARSYPLLVSELFLSGYTEAKVDALLKELSLYEIPSDRSLKSTSKFFARTFLTNLVPSLITLPIITIAILYAADIGTKRRFLGLKDLLQQFNNDKTLGKTLLVGAKFVVLKALSSGIFAAITFKCNDTTSRSWSSYFVDLAFAWLGMTTGCILQGLSTSSIVSVAAGGNVHGLAEVKNQAFRYFCNEFGIIGFVIMAA